MDNSNFSPEELASIEKTKGDLILFQHGTAWADPLLLVEPLQCSEIREVFYSFKDNIKQTMNLSNLLLKVIAPTIVIERATANAIHALEDCHDLTDEETRRKFIDKRINYDINKYWQNYYPGHSNGNYPDYISEIINTAFYNLAFSCQDISVRNGVRSLLLAQITGAWTSIEVMFRDLWEQAVNICPGELCGQDSKYLGSIIHIEKLKKYNFDISKNLGTLMREKSQFNDMNDIKKFYKSSFDPHDPTISKFLEDLNIRKLKLVRNMIVHKAAKYDADYLDLTSKIPDAPTGEIGDDLGIDAEVVHGLLFPALRCACSLIRSVDIWLFEHRQK